MGNQYREWIEEEIKYLKDNYKQMTDEELGARLNRPTNGIASKRKKLKLLREKSKNKYSEEFAKEQLVRIFNEIKRPPNKDDGKKYKMKPARDWYVEKYGSIEDACVHFGLMGKSLTVEERMIISIEELKNIAKKLKRIPCCDEYLKMKDKGYSEYPLQQHFNMTYVQICDKYLSEYKENIPEGYKKCSVCGTIKVISEYNINSIASSGVRSSCKLCDYIKRNGLNIPKGWTEEECKILIDNLINEKINYINELCLILNRELDDITNVLDKYIKIFNKPLNIKVYCAYCGKEEIKSLSVYLHNKDYFCSHECYWNYKREFEPKGEEHQSYKRIETKCDNCGSDIKVIPYEIENRKHNFCSQQCYWEFRSKHYVGENHPLFGVEKTPEQKRRMRIATTNRYTTGSFNRLTKPQIIVNEILKELNINFIHEHNCKYYSIDDYLTDYNLMIEVQGDYFHANPLKFKQINNMQFKDIVRDKKKRTYIKKYKDINILYLWEDDINKNPEMIKEIILYYINNNGMIDDYNSFNYSLINKEIILNDKLIKPYIDYTAKELNLIKKENIKINVS